MFKKLHTLLMHSEWKLSLWQAVFGASGLMGSFSLSAWAASASDLLNAYGPLGWVGAGFIGALAFTSCLALVGWFRLGMAKARFLNRRSYRATEINILEKDFYQKIVTSDSIYDHLTPTIIGKNFRECRFRGPITLAFVRNDTLLSPYLNSCNFVLIPDTYIPKGTIGFLDCTFRDCEFIDVTFFVNKSLADSLKKGVPDEQLYVIGYTPPQA